MDRRGIYRHVCVSLCSIKDMVLKTNIIAFESILAKQELPKQCKLWLN